MRWADYWYTRQDDVKHGGVAFFCGLEANQQFSDLTSRLHKVPGIKITFIMWVSVTSFRFISLSPIPPCNTDGIQMRKRRNWNSLEEELQNIDTIWKQPSLTCDPIQSHLWSNRRLQRQSPPSSLLRDSKLHYIELWSFIDIKQQSKNSRWRRSESRACSQIWSIIEWR